MRFCSVSSALTLLTTLYPSRAESSPALGYHERLVLRPLPQSALLASFNFRSNESSTSFEQQNFRYFPRSLGQILQHARTKELHLRFSLGRWDSESWGNRPWDGTREGGTGVELWAWVEAVTDAEANSRWLTLTNALSGLFCASLNFIDSTKTIRPVMTFQPEGHHPDGSLADLQLLHGTLPREVVCTENLTPFLKLLPCKGKAGISSLLDGHKLFDASWQTMAIDVRPVCPNDGSDCILEIEQTVDMVLDIHRSKRPRGNPIPRPVPIKELSCDTSKPYSSHDSCFPLDKSETPAWSLREIFGRSLKGACPLSSLSADRPETVCLDVHPQRAIRVDTHGDYIEKTYESENLRCYRPPTGTDFDLYLEAHSHSQSTPIQEPALHASRYITGHGQERGGVQATITNPSTGRVDVIYLESIPWFMKPYLHTLRATVSPSQGTRHSEDPVRHRYYRPALDRHRGTHLELLLSIPPNSTLTLHYDFEKAILRYTEYPPDANRGFDVAPAVIRLLSPESRPSHGIYLRTTSLLLSLPTPDFSMPYNVIILTSTVMALGFGSIFNLLVRRFVGANEVEKWNFGHFTGDLRVRLKSFITRSQGKGTKAE